MNECKEACKVPAATVGLSDDCSVEGVRILDHLPRPKFSNCWPMQRNFSSEIALGSAEPRILLSTCHSLKSRAIAKKKFYLLSEANDNFANVTVV